MKAAFLFSGQLRGFNHCLPSLQKHLFDKFEESDKFCYCAYDDIDRIDEVKLLQPKSLVFEEDFHHIIEKFVDPNNSITYSKGRIEHNGYELKGRMQHYFLQWYGVKRAYEMMESFAIHQGKTYDVVFRIRFDSCPKKDLDLDSLKLDHINVPDFEHWFGLHDRFACGNMQNMRVYCKKYESFTSNNLGAGNSESRLKQHLLNNNIPVNKIDFYYTRVHNDGTLQQGMAN
jgi:hypothetical protein